MVEVEGEEEEQKEEEKEEEVPVLAQLSAWQCQLTDPKCSEKVSDRETSGLLI